MFIDDFIWLPTIIDKLHEKHHVTPDEAEQVFFNKPKYRFVEIGHNQGEDVYSALGRTDAGRFIAVFFIRKQDNSALILSARDMDDRERKRYAKK